VSVARHRWIALLGGALVLASALAAEVALDGDLLEFLGSVDAEGDGWGEYLERTDVNRVARPAAETPRGEQPQQPPVEPQVQKP
jgi:hypothetical protein